MASSSLPPFPELASAADPGLVPTDWMLGANRVGHRSAILGWDYSMPLRLRRTISVQPEKVRSHCQLGSDTSLTLATEWTALSALNVGRPGPAVTFELSGEATLTLQLDMEVPSDQLAEELRVSTILVLKRSGNGSSPVSAREPGSILWREQAVVVLEGTRPRMPILPTDFSHLKGSERNAAWHVWTGPDWLSQHPSVGICVQLNAARPNLVAALSSRQSGPVEAAILSFFIHDIGRMLFERALADDEFSDEADFPRGSSGYSLRASLRALFDRQTLAQIRKLRHEDAAAFERALQSRHQLLGDVG